MRIEISNHGDSYYDSWHEYFEWNGKSWIFHDEVFENESGMMGAFNRTEYHKIREDLNENDRKAILKFFNLSEKQIPLKDVPTYTPEQYIRASINKIYDDCDSDNKKKNRSTPNYNDKTGVTTCFVFNDIDEKIKDPALDSLAKLIDSINNSIIEILKDKRLNQKYERRDGKECHITAASIINPGEVSTEFDWNKNVNIIKTILKDSRLIPFKFSFDRLHVGVDGIVVLVGYPDSIYVRNFKENIFNKFNAERWWMDFSVAPAIGVFDVDISCEEAQSILKSIKLPQQRVLGINNLFVIHYRNRRIIPEKDVISISKIF